MKNIKFNMMNNTKSREQIIKKNSMPFKGCGLTYSEMLKDLTSHLDPQRCSEVINQALTARSENSVEVTFLKSPKKK